MMREKVRRGLSKEFTKAFLSIYQHEYGEQNIHPEGRTKVYISQALRERLLEGMHMCFICIRWRPLPNNTCVWGVQGNINRHHFTDSRVAIHLGIPYSDGSYLRFKMPIYGYSALAGRIFQIWDTPKTSMKVSEPFLHQFWHFMSARYASRHQTLLNPPASIAFLWCIWTRSLSISPMHVYTHVQFECLVSPDISSIQSWYTHVLQMVSRLTSAFVRFPTNEEHAFRPWMSAYSTKVFPCTFHVKIPEWYRGIPWYQIIRARGVGRAPLSILQGSLLPIWDTDSTVSHIQVHHIAVGLLWGQRSVRRQERLVKFRGKGTRASLPM